MKTIFLSWSGDTSRELAQVFHEWLPTVLLGISPFFSDEALRSGTRWFAEIGANLESNSFGLLFITPDNVTAPWLMFEAGAIGKTAGDSSVCPIAFAMPLSDLQGPLREFQARLFDKESIWKIIRDINSSREDNRAEEHHIRRSFDRAWAELDERVKKILVERANPQPEQRRSQADILEEILDLCRNMARRNEPQPVDPLLLERTTNFIRNYNAHILRRSLDETGASDQAGADSDSDLDS